MTLNRREALAIIAGGVTAAWLGRGGIAMAGQGSQTDTGGSKATDPRAKGAGPAVGAHVLKPLPFNPRSLRGLSERLLTSHHENNYGGALKNLNKVEEELARASKETPGFIVGGLRERELTFTNSVILHEAYFGNLGGGGRADGAIQSAVAEGFGSFGRWEEMFRATAMSLAGGSGWTILDLNLHTGDLRTYWSGNHTQALAMGWPLLVLDMYEHAYAIDYGAAAARYVDAFFDNVQWDEVNRRYERARRAAAIAAT